MKRQAPAAPWLRFRFLGGSEILVGGEPVRLETAKTRALLAYLVSNPTAQSRTALMGLLWGDLPEANARRNLRRALWNLRRQLVLSGDSPPLLADREAICFDRKMPFWSDVKVFEDACSGLEQVSESSDPALDLDELRQGIDLYRGEFLEGLFVKGAPVFEEWVLVERQRLHVRAMRALQVLVEAYASQTRTEMALEYARRLLVLEPWRERTHRWLMRLLASSGLRSEAMAQYEACRQLLAEELGVEPARETRALYEEIRAGAYGIAASNLPASTTPFVGRARELGELAALLGRADCRLLTVTGLGGAGKTRLAREAAARQSAQFRHGVHYVALGALSAHVQLASALARSMGIPLVGTLDPEALLLAYLRQKQMLLVLDGFEHLLAGAPLLTTILQTAPETTLLVTSRERLNLRGEWVYPLEGLACAPEGQLDTPGSFDAAQLFVQTARRVDLAFQIGEGERFHLARICGLVAGLPLAIELAAAWVRVLSLAEIADQITEQLDFLADAMRDRPERHRSIRAVFDHAWRLLSEKERDVFRRLSVFRGSFGLAEAKQVGGSLPMILSALVDKALLQRLPSGRYQLHELLRHYGLEQLAQIHGEEERIRDLHCGVYAVRLGKYEQSLKDSTHMPILRAIGEDLENVHAAWRWAIERRNNAAVDAMHAALADYLHLTTSFREGETLFGKALADLGWAGEGGDQGLLACKLRSSQATFSVYLGHFAEALTSLESCLAVFVRAGAQDEAAHCEFFLGEIARFTGEYDLARERFASSLSGYRQVGNPSAVGFCLNGLGLVSAALGEKNRARAYLKESLAMFSESGHKMGQAIAGINLADLLIRLKDHAAAIEILEESKGLCDKLGHRWGVATCVRYLADIARLEGQDEEARAALLESLRILHEIGQRQTAAGCLIKLGQICIDLGQLGEAQKHLREALATTDELGDRAQMLEAAESLARLWAGQGDVERALELVLVVERDSTKAPAAQERARQLIAELASQIPEKVFQLFQERAGSGTLANLLADAEFWSGV